MPPSRCAQKPSAFRGGEARAQARSSASGVARPHRWSAFGGPANQPPATLPPRNHRRRASDRRPASNPGLCSSSATAPPTAPGRAVRSSRPTVRAGADPTPEPAGSIGSPRRRSRHPRSPTRTRATTTSRTTARRQHRLPHRHDHRAVRRSAWRSDAVDEDPTGICRPRRRRSAPRRRWRSPPPIDAENLSVASTASTPKRCAG